MGFGVMKLYSHPDKLLSEHTNGVYEKTCRLTGLPMARVAALFHDFGKVNPNFQKKLSGARSVGYSHHAYLSAYLWLQVLHQNKHLQESLDISAYEDIVAVTAIIAKHHADLPDFKQVFNPDEIERLKSFLKSNPTLPIDGLLSALGPLKNTSVVPVQDGHVAVEGIRGISLPETQNQRPLQFFLKARFAFGSLINADKTDAGGYASLPNTVTDFCSTYQSKLDAFLVRLNQSTELNQLRTSMRRDAVARLRTHLDGPQRVFALTAPTGAGKTLMLLSLAAEIIRTKGAYRIVYSLPFLSITEQIYSICCNIFGSDIRRIDSRAENEVFEDSQQELDGNPESIRHLLENEFAEDTFDFPFIITTFVRFFETLLSNKNTTLLKFPNFSRSIFLIDEIQALPPRLYTFFVALLDAFCQMFDSYAIISTATMPDFRLPQNNPSLVSFFNGYAIPPELLSEEYFHHRQFDRYVVHPLTEKLSTEKLAERLIDENQSTLVILNTIEDTKRLYEYLVNVLKINYVLLLNTHFTPNDRLRKLDVARRALRREIKLIVVSTQLIEAGVDIDFPVVYRDWAPLSSIVQSAGRCNRNNKRPTKGKLVFLELEKEGKSRWQLIYRGVDRRLVSDIADSLTGSDWTESKLYARQHEYFEHIRSNLLFGYHQGKRFSLDNEIYFVDRIKQAAFEEIGKFQLIEENEFGEEIRYYVPISDSDTSFETLQEYVRVLRTIPHNDFVNRRIQQLRIDGQLRRMSGQVVQLRLKRNESRPISNSDSCYDLQKLSMNQYSYKTGIKLDSSNQII